MRKLSVRQVKALVPLYERLEVQTVEDLLFLGMANIRHMVKQWRREAEGSAHEILELQKRFDLLANKDSAAMIELGRHYESPDFPRVGIAPDMIERGDRYPEPFDAESIKRKCGATTFNFCGWCEHGSSSLGRCGYDYMFKPTCRFEMGKGQTRQFNSPCIFKTMTSEQFDKMRAAIARARDKVVRRKKIEDRKIRTLLSLAKQAEVKPLTPDRRNFCDLPYKVGERVVCYVGQERNRETEKEFVLGEVVKGEDHLTVVFDDKVGGSVIGGYGGTYNLTSPWIMSFGEFGYLLTHPDFVLAWVGSRYTSSRDDVKAELFAEALKRQHELQTQ